MYVLVIDLGALHVEGVNGCVSQSINVTVRWRTDCDEDAVIIITIMLMCHLLAVNVFEFRLDDAARHVHNLQVMYKSFRFMQTL